MGAPSDIVKTCFIEPMQGTFRKVPGSSPDAYFASLSEKLAGASEEVLAAVAASLIGRATSSTWPYVSAVVAACKDAEQRLKRDQQKKAGNAGAAQLKDPWLESVAVKALVDYDAKLATTAALEGWHAELIDFVRQDKRVPTKEEVKGFVVSTRARDARIANQHAEALRVLSEDHDSKLKVLPARHPVQILVTAIATRRSQLAVLIAKEIEAREEAAQEEHSAEGVGVWGALG